VKYLSLAFALAAVAVGLGATYGAAVMLRLLGFGTIFAGITISDAMKLLISLYLTCASTSVALSGLALFVIARERIREAGWLGVFASIWAVGTTLVVPAFSTSLDPVSTTAILVGAALCLVGASMGLRAPPAPSRRPFLSTLEIANSAVLSALTAILTGIAFVPSPTGGFTHIGDTIIFLAALLFGSKVGAITGVVGSVAADLWVGYPRWFVSIPAHGLEGLIAGLGQRRSIATQIISCAIGGIVMASVYFYVNIFIKGWALAVISYARDMLGQAGVSIILAIVLTRTLKRILPRFGV
jgi:uncharacterized membrane protein